MTAQLKLVRLSMVAFLVYHLAHCQTTESAVLFQGPVREVLEHRCIHCHHYYAKNGGLNLQDRKSVFQGDKTGPFIIPGKPRESRLWTAMFPPGHPNVMPGDGWQLPQDKVKAFMEWIETGAYWPEGRDGKLKMKRYLVELDDYL